MKWFLVIILCVSVMECKKVFKSRPVTVKPYENETVLLPCYFEETEIPPRIKWYRNSTLLGDTGDPNHLLPMRIRIHANYSLQIDWLSENDTAEYTCEVMRPQPLGIIKQTHSILVLCVPKIRTIPEDGFVEVKKGDTVDIGCIVSGTPASVIDWKKNGEPMALLEHRSRLRFRAEDRDLGGDYECVATNGVGDPVAAKITVLVLDAPIVRTSHSTVHASLDYRVTLSAQLMYAVPPAVTHWYKDGVPVHSDDRILIKSNERDQTLVIRNVKKSDFGNYTFRAENKLGMADVTIVLSGIPNPPSFIIDPSVNKASKTGFTLIWETEAYSTIIVYHLWIRQHFRDVEGIWKKLVVPGDSGEGPIHTASFILTGLHPSTIYEATVNAKNKLGWSAFSHTIRFSTEPGHGRLPSTENYSEMTPYADDFEPEAHNITTAQIYNVLFSAGNPLTTLPSAILMLASILVFV